MTRYEKIAISLPSRAAETVRRAVKRGEAKSVSAFVAAAIEEKTTKESFMRMLDEMLEESGGPLTPAERRWADRTLAATPPWPRSSPPTKRTKRTKRAKTSTASRR